MQGYGERLPVEYRVSTSEPPLVGEGKYYFVSDPFRFQRPEIVEPLSRWNRTRAGRAGGERFSITKLHDELMARERSTEASSSSASTAPYSSAGSGSGSRQSSQAPTVYWEEDRPGRSNRRPNDSALDTELSGSLDQAHSPISNYPSINLIHAPGIGGMKRFV